MTVRKFLRAPLLLAVLMVLVASSCHGDKDPDPSCQEQARITLDVIPIIILSAGQTEKHMGIFVKRKAMELFIIPKENVCSQYFL
jgi:hypothetical protein